LPLYVYTCVFINVFLPVSRRQPLPLGEEARGTRGGGEKNPVKVLTEKIIKSSRLYRRRPCLARGIVEKIVGRGNPLLCGIRVIIYIYIYIYRYVAAAAEMCFCERDNRGEKFALKIHVILCCTPHTRG